MPDSVHIALFCGVFAVLAFLWTQAQRVGDYRSKALARTLALIATLLSVLWIYLGFLWFLKIDLRLWIADHHWAAWLLVVVVVAWVYAFGNGSAYGSC